MDRAQKHAFVTDLNNRLSGASSMVVAHYRGLTVKQLQAFRRKLREQGAEAQVAKNRLAKLAMKDTAFDSVVESMLKGPTLLAFSKDAVAAAKVAQKFADENKQMVILGGALDGKTLSAADVKALSTMPSLDELRGKIVGLLQAPATKVAGVLQAPAGQLARVMGAYSKKAA